MPEQVRLRVVALAADALGQIPADQLPAPLRRVASFAPQRRARVAASQIAATLESDDAFRARVATQVRLVVPELAGALDAQEPPPAADPVQVAAVAYLLALPGWPALASAAAEKVPAATTPERSETVDRLERQLAEARAQVRGARERGKQQVAEVKQANAELRRTLADTRQQLRDAEQLAAREAAAQESAATRIAAAEAETRRLRSRVSELEASSSAARRAVRDERDTASLRARLLLDTLLESAQGLRRELALPTVTGAPADAVEGTVSSDESTPAGTGLARSSDDPALLEELFALPRVHVVIDGYNVTKTAWASTPLESQRNRLLTGLAPVVARHSAEITVVFDGADLAAPPPVSGPRGVRVMFSPPGVIADDVIGELVDVEPGGRPVVVVSSDREVATAATRAGARAVDSAALVRMLARA